MPDPVTEQQLPPCSNCEAAEADADHERMTVRSLRHELAMALDAWQRKVCECDELRAEIDRMRPVVNAAMQFVNHEPDSGRKQAGHRRAMYRAVGKYRHPEHGDRSTCTCPQLPGEHLWQRGCSGYPKDDTHLEHEPHEWQEGRCKYSCQHPDHGFQVREDADDLVHCPGCDQDWLAAADHVAGSEECIDNRREDVTGRISEERFVFHDPEHGTPHEDDS